MRVVNSIILGICYDNKVNRKCLATIWSYQGYIMFGYRLKSCISYYHTFYQTEIVGTWKGWGLSALVGQPS